MKYKIIVISVIALLVIIAVVGFIFGRKTEVGVGGTITFWGTDLLEIWSPIITAYQTANPAVIVNYTKKNPDTYEKELVNALASGSGPDIAFIGNTWLNKHLEKFSPAPSNIISAQNFGNIFVDVASQDLIRSGRVYAVPFFVDTIGLYYNKSLFNNAGIVNPPKTWDEFGENVKRLTSKDPSGNIIRSGAALGTASNVEYASDILSLLMLQTGTVMINKDEGRADFDRSVALNSKSYSPGVSSLDFYTGFANSSKPVYSWNSRMIDSLSAFEQGKTAMYFGYAKDLKAIKNSGVGFVVAPSPQVKDSRQDASYIDINFGSYSAGAVTQKSANKTAAWNFLAFAISQNAAGTYLKLSLLPPARKDLIEFTASNSALNVFANQALTASSWAQPDDVEVKKIFDRMITSVSLGQSKSADAIKEAAIEVTNLLK
jgi:multiple sugar transport system substrate-binding protein